MTQAIARITGVIFMIAISAMASWSAEEQRINNAAGETPRESMYQGKPLSYWLRSIRDRDDKIVLALDAITDLGPEAWPAVEELTRIVAEPFTPVRIGVDLNDVVAAKLSSIRLRSGGHRCFDCNWRGRCIFGVATDSMGAGRASHSDKSRYSE